MAKKTVSTFSAILLLCAGAYAVDFAHLKQDFDSAPTSNQKIEVLRTFLDQNPAVHKDDPALESDFHAFQESKGSAPSSKDIDNSLSLRIDAQQAQQDGAGASIANEAHQIKASPLYRDDHVGQSNWISNAIQHLLEMLQRHAPKPGPVHLGVDPGDGRIFKYILIGLIAVVVLVLGFLFARQFQYKRSIRRKASALLEEDEPLRTADEWLELADGLTSQGRFREAVRCLYLACLLRFDEADVARFQREQTNWEHLQRIQASAKMPAGLDFLAPTRAFDTVWYGQQVRGIEDVEQFRAWYSSIVAQLRQEAA